MEILGALGQDSFKQAREALLKFILTETVEDLNSLAGALDQASLAQNAQVVGAGGGRKVIQLFSYAGAIEIGIGTVGQFTDHGEAYRITQRGEHAFQRDIGHAGMFETAHADNIQINGRDFNISIMLKYYLSDRTCSL